MTEQQHQVAHLSEKVMGWKLQKSARGRRMEAWVGNKWHVLWSPYDADRVFLFDPFASIADAMDLLDAWELGEPTRSSSIYSEPHLNIYGVTLTEGKVGWHANGPDRKTAIINCLLKVTGWKEQP